MCERTTMWKLIVLLFLFAMTVSSKHIHPRSIVRVEETQIDLDTESKAKIDRAAIDVIRRPPTRFVPVNSVFFFRKYAPCEDGFERDLLGICREVWY